jgi:threonine synthase
MGYSEYFHKGVVNRRPHMVGYQASGAAPFLRGHPVAEPETVATAIRIGAPQSWDKAWAAQRESQGWFDEFDDTEILAAQKLLAEQEGIFCEPSSAVSLAGALRDVNQGRIPVGSRIVCTLTGHGLKDSDTAIKQNTSPLLKVVANLDAVRDAILGHMA